MNVFGLFKGIVSILPATLRRNIYWYKNRVTRKKNVMKWELSGRPVPPPHQYKQIVIEQLSKKYQFNNFVETGTFLGHMIEAQRKNFKKLYSIEVEPKLYLDAYNYFKPYTHIKILKGDSAFELKTVLGDIQNDSVLFWLDGHYSGENTGMGENECPIFRELETILINRIDEKYILIDDARCFNGNNDYPTIAEIIDFVQNTGNGLKITVLNDIIHIY